MVTTSQVWTAFGGLAIVEFIFLLLRLRFGWRFFGAGTDPVRDVVMSTLTLGSLSVLLTIMAS